MQLSNLTQTLVERAGGLMLPEWEHATQGPYQQFNSAGTEIEVSEFLYGLIRMLKPRHILETGTHKGISSSYMGLALQDNGIGSLETLEIFEENRQDAMKLWSRLDLPQEVVACTLQESLKFVPAHTYQFVMLDSEPHLRFDEFERFWPAMDPGCVVVIHDLHPHLGHSGSVINGMYDWPYGDVRKTFLGEAIRTHLVSAMSFPTPRGIAMFQRSAPEFLHTQLARGEQ